MNVNRRLLMGLTAFLVCQIVAPPGRAQSPQGANALQGAWRNDTKAQNAPPGVDGYRSFITFAAGGSTVEFNGRPGLGPGTGSWEFLRAGEFVAIWLKPLYDSQTGALQATIKIRSHIRMTSADEYEAHDTSDLFLPDGALAVSWTAIHTGKRIKVELVD